jgi:integrase
MGFRNRAIVAVLVFCGLRRQELIDVKISDIDLQSRWLKVRRGKGGKGRSIPLAPEAADAIRDWLEFRP